VKTIPPTFYLFAGSNGAGKTTFAKAYLRQLDPIPRFLNADEIARGLSPLAPQTLALRAGKLLLHEIQGCLESGKSFGLESTLSGTTYTKLLQQAKISGYQIEIHYLWIPTPALAVRRIAQRVKMGGHSIPDSDVKRRFSRSLANFLEVYAPLSDCWTFRNNSIQPASLLFDSANSTLLQIKDFLCR
jgi:predicted ABC-type ATPase